MPRILSVRELTGAVRDILRTEFPFVWVRGELSNFRQVAGHIYFSLKDETSLLHVVWFSSSRERINRGIDPLTGEIVDEQPPLANGMEVLCAGHLDVYGMRGEYQLRAELVQPQGVGQLQFLFEELKQKLLRQGLFEVQKKKSLPKNPERVAVVTAPGSAALRDFLKLAHERGFGGEVRIYPTLVQGKAAPAQICSALQQVETDGWAQAIALVRGGGSLEDLWAFNDESVVRQIADCKVPIVSGIGHEIDTSLADLAADVRSATPTHAAQLLWSEREPFVQLLDDLYFRLQRRIEQYLEYKRQEYVRFFQALQWFSPQKKIERTEEKCRQLQLDLQRFAFRFLAEKQDRLPDLYRRLRRAVRFECDSSDSVLESVRDSCVRAMQNRLQSFFERLGILQQRLLGLDPQKPLQRGYCRLENESGDVLVGVDGVEVGERVKIYLQDGFLGARVEELEKQGKKA